MEPNNARVLRALFVICTTSSETKPLTYIPWETDQYSVLACKPDYCFVVHAVAHKT